MTYEKQYVKNALQEHKKIRLIRQTTVGFIVKRLREIEQDKEALYIPSHELTDLPKAKPSVMDATFSLIFSNRYRNLEAERQMLVSHLQDFNAEDDRLDRIICLFQRLSMFFPNHFYVVDGLWYTQRGTVQGIASDLRTRVANIRQMCDGFLTLMCEILDNEQLDVRTLTMPDIRKFICDELFENLMKFEGGAQNGNYRN